MRAIVYCRVSSDEQAASGLGLEAQEHSCQQWAERESRLVVGPFLDEAVSGATPLEDRPGLLDAIAAIGPGDVLLVAKRDRLGRDLIRVAMIEAAVASNGGRTISVAGEGTADDDPSSIMQRHMTDVFAEYERLIIKFRTRAALAAKRRRGDRVGPTPFGHRLVDDGRRSKRGNLPVALVVDEAEIAIIAEVKVMHAAGRSLRQIARDLDVRGVRPKAGGDTWSHTSVRKLILRTA